MGEGPSARPTAIVIGGVNGAGKTSASQSLLAEKLALMTFVNADAIAGGLNAFAPEVAALEAGRIMLTRLHELALARNDFAFETTLAGRSYIRFLRRLRSDGYQVSIYYFWLQTAELAIERVRQRVKRGGHNIPDETVKRRFCRSVSHFWNDYRLECDYWATVDNSAATPSLTAESHAGTITIANPLRWAAFQELVPHAS
jgi:predicted ABC-type ATPase